MRIIKLLLIFFICDASGEVWFVPGWRTGFADLAGCMRILKDAYPGHEIKLCSWDSQQAWNLALNNAREHVEKLFQRIIHSPETSRQNLILVGHSVGGKIVLDVLSRLALDGKRIYAAAVLAAALPCDDPRIGSALHAVKFEICNVYNPGDWVLKYIYPLGNDFVVPLGCAGWSGYDSRFIEIRTSAPENGFVNHFAYLYLEALDRRLNALTPRIEVKQVGKISETLPADEIYWEDVDIVQNWKIQQHYDGRARILDPTGVRRSEGTYGDMCEVFANISSQLQKRE